MDTYRNFIDGKWVESASSKTVNNINPGKHRRRHRHNQAGHPRRSARRGRSCGRKPFTAGARRRRRRADESSRKAARLMEEAQGRAGPNPDARRRQDDRRIARRAAALDQCRGVLRGRIAPHEWRDDSFRVAVELCLHDQTTAGRCCLRHALEFSGGDSRSGKSRRRWSPATQSFSNRRR